jgi:hypothetical protein
MSNIYAGKNMVRVNDRPFKDGKVPSNGEELSGDNEMSNDSNHDKDGSSRGGVRDKREDNAKQLRRLEWGW